jgi:malate synthase
VLQDDEHAGVPVTAELCDEVIDAELARVVQVVDEERFKAYEHAAFLMRELIKTPKFQDFLTVPAYARVLDHEVYTA